MKQPPLTLHLARPEDADACLAIYGPVVRDTAASFETAVPTRETFAERIARTLPTHPWIVARSGAAGSVVGYAYARPHRDRAAYRWSCEVSVYVADGWRRGGVGRRLYDALLDSLRVLGYVNAYAIIALPNPASVAFHECLGFEPIALYPRAGFKRVGTSPGRWVDVGWWRLELRDPPPSPAPPGRLADWRDAVEHRIRGSGG